MFHERTSTKVIRDNTAEMSRAFLVCRSRGHRWPDEAHYYKVPDSKPEIAEQILLCDRCGTERVDRLIRRRGGRWEFHGRQYNYAEGYLAAADAIKLTRADYTSELVRRDLSGG